MKRNMLKVLVVVAILGLYALPASADQIFFCASLPCTSAPGGTAIGGESNLINPSGFYMGLAGSANDQSPILVVVAVINGTSSSPQPSVSFTPTPSLATLGTYGLTHNTATLTSGNAWTAIGLPNGGGSESFSNFTFFDNKNGFGTPTTYGLFVFELNTGLTAGTPIMLDLSGAPNGSYILAFGCEDGSTTSQCDHGDVSQTVMTNTGLQTGHVPEPGTLALFGAGLLGLGGLSVRRLFGRE